MSGILTEIQRLVAAGDVRISAHGYDELAEDGIFARDVIDGVGSAVVVEVPKDRSGPAVVVTAYRPDPRRWSDNFMERLP